MGAAVEIRDIKIINQCLEVQEGVGVACLFSFSVCLSPSMFISLYFSLFLSLTHYVFGALSGGGVGSEPQEVSAVKVVLNAATHESAPQGRSHPLIWQ